MRFCNKQRGGEMARSGKCIPFFATRRVGSPPPIETSTTPTPLCFLEAAIFEGIDTPSLYSSGLNERSGDEPVVPQPAETVLSVYRSRLVWVRGERWKRSSNSALPSSGIGFGMQILGLLFFGFLNKISEILRMLGIAKKE
ncbi:hypothetical protein CDAR_49881 [Caerostris darwini]|uniref:Uncharacterized protein n=1 Tax=Caerostris darwini TaxID=1538125 RepID=A0AAV4UHP5_9ARAC|nr:hypothetical protein CDAR_49881 [Caerostris darwini]